MRQTSLAGATDAMAPEPPDLRLGGSRRIPMLEVVRALAARFDEAGIRYCQFKSNWHLDQGVRGLTDLDVLVDPGAGSKLTAMLASSGYKLFSPPPGGDYPGVEDYLAMDEPTGRLVHLHLHHQLITGERHLKGYRFPWEEQMLATRQRDEDTGFFTSEPGIELLFLLVRNTLKIRLSDRIKAVFGPDPIRHELTREFLWLRDRARIDRIVELGRSLFGNAVEPALREILEAGPSLPRMSALRRQVMPVLEGYRRYAPTTAWLQRRRHELQSLHSKIGRRFPALAGATSRTDPRGGVLIALMGPDGSGKSTLVRAITSWLRWKLDARVVYFGSGDGPSSLARWPLKLVLRAGQSLGFWAPTGRRERGAHGEAPGRNAGGPGIARALWALLLSLEKRQTLRRAWRARARGIVVVCDRYPQRQIMGFNDGPLLDPWTRSASGVLRALARWESIPYRWAEAQPPRLVIKLHVSPRVAVDRKPGMRTEEIERRREALARLQYPDPTRVVDVDADRSRETVLLDCKRRIWETL